MPTRASSSPVPERPRSQGAIHARFAPGTVIADRYQVHALVGRGGMGEVYRAEDLRLGQTVALKFLPEALAGDPGLRDRLFQEVRIARRVTHPDVCRVYDIGEHEGQFFLSMEFVDGLDLASLLRQVGPLTSDRAIQLARHLCAGLAAAHDKGILHRDLKPANILIDSAGEVRITDFGLAVLAREGQESSRTGTPAYMAPEQIAGRAASIRSDVYSLGLVLYEMFTGRRAYQAESLEELLRSREEPPVRPSRHVHDLDPRVEATILRCLEKDPARRPPTAIAVSSSLPGGDPLAEALAAGLTPTPEMLAAAPVEGSLGSPAAWGLLGLCCAGMILTAILSGRAGLVQSVSPDRPPAVLADRARQIVAALGYAGAPRSEAWGYDIDTDYLQHVERTDPSADRWRALESGGSPALFFWYRRSQRPMVPHADYGRVSLVDPAPLDPGMVSLLLDPQGRLIEFHAVPGQTRREAPDAAPPAASADWAVLLAEAGLEPERLPPTAPIWTPPVYGDAAAAWDLPDSGSADRRRRAEAAALEGRPVYFQIGGAWTRRVHIEPRPKGAASRASEALILTLHLFILGSCLFLARRNLRLGRGDWKGALRASGYIAAAVMLAWLFHAPHVTSVNEEWELFVISAGLALFIAACFWVIYVALEPYLRSRWPRRFVSWNRLLAGRLGDPLVGRDLLIGSLAGTVWSLLVVVQNLAPRWLGQAPPAPLGIQMATLAGVRGWLATFFQFQPNVVVTPVAYMVLILLFHVILGREWLAAGLFLVLMSVGLSLQAGGRPSDVILCVAIVGLWLITMLRFGLLAMMAAFNAHYVSNFPISGDLAAWYSGGAIFALAVGAALAIYGFRTALGDRPILSRIDLRP